jgi:hypothetical protein
VAMAGMFLCVGSGGGFMCQMIQRCMYYQQSQDILIYKYEKFPQETKNQSRTIYYPTSTNNTTP